MPEANISVNGKSIHISKRADYTNTSKSKTKDLLEHSIITNSTNIDQHINRIHYPINAQETKITNQTQTNQAQIYHNLRDQPELKDVNSKDSNHVFSKDKYRIKNNQIDNSFCFDKSNIKSNENNSYMSYNRLENQHCIKLNIDNMHLSETYESRNKKQNKFEGTYLKNKKNFNNNFTNQYENERDFKLYNSISKCIYKKNSKSHYKKYKGTRDSKNKREQTRYLYNTKSTSRITIKKNIPVGYYNHTEEKKRNYSEETDHENSRHKKSIDKYLRKGKRYCSGLRTLDLTGQGLADLSDLSSHRFPNLESIYLNNNDLSDILQLSHLSQFSKLSYLDITGNPFSKTVSINLIRAILPNHITIKSGKNIYYRTERKNICSENISLLSTPQPQNNENSNVKNRNSAKNENIDYDVKLNSACSSFNYRHIKQYTVPYQSQVKSDIEDNNININDYSYDQENKTNTKAHGFNDIEIFYKYKNIVQMQSNPVIPTNNISSLDKQDKNTIIESREENKIERTSFTPETSQRRRNKIDKKNSDNFLSQEIKNPSDHNLNNHIQELPNYRTISYSNSVDDIITKDTPSMNLEKINSELYLDHNQHCLSNPSIKEITRVFDATSDNLSNDVYNSCDNQLSKDQEKLNTINDSKTQIPIVEENLLISSKNKNYIVPIYSNISTDSLGKIPCSNFFERQELAELKLELLNLKNELDIYKQLKHEKTDYSNKNINQFTDIETKDNMSKAIKSPIKKSYKTSLSNSRELSENLMNSETEKDNKNVSTINPEILQRDQKNSNLPKTNINCQIMKNNKELIKKPVTRNTQSKSLKNSKNHKKNDYYFNFKNTRNKTNHNFSTATDSTEYETNINLAGDGYPEDQSYFYETIVDKLLLAHTNIDCKAPLFQNIDFESCMVLITSLTNASIQLHNSNIDLERKYNGALKEIEKYRERAFRSNRKKNHFRDLLSAKSLQADSSKREAAQAKKQLEQFQKQINDELKLARVVLNTESNDNTKGIYTVRHILEKILPHGLNVLNSFSYFADQFGIEQLKNLPLSDSITKFCTNHKLLNYDNTSFLNKENSNYENCSIITQQSITPIYKKKITFADSCSQSTQLPGTINTLYTDQPHSYKAKSFMYSDFKESNSDLIHDSNNEVKKNLKFDMLDFYRNSLTSESKQPNLLQHDNDTKYYLYQNYPEYVYGSKAYTEVIDNLEKLVDNDIIDSHINSNITSSTNVSYTEKLELMSISKYNQNNDFSEHTRNQQSNSYKHPTVVGCSSRQNSYKLRRKIYDVDIFDTDSFNNRLYSSRNNHIVNSHHTKKPFCYNMDKYNYTNNKHLELQNYSLGSESSSFENTNLSRKSIHFLTKSGYIRELQRENVNSNKLNTSLESKGYTISSEKILQSYNYSKYIPYLNQKSETKKELSTQLYANDDIYKNPQLENTILLINENNIDSIYSSDENNENRCDFNKNISSDYKSFNYDSLKAYLQKKTDFEYNQLEFRMFGTRCSFPLDKLYNNESNLIMETSFSKEHSYNYISSIRNQISSDTKNKYPYLDNINLKSLSSSENPLLNNLEAYPEKNSVRSIRAYFNNLFGINKLSSRVEQGTEIECNGIASEMLSSRVEQDTEIECNGIASEMLSSRVEQDTEIECNGIASEMLSSNIEQDIDNNRTIFELDMISSNFNSNDIGCTRFKLDTLNYRNWNKNDIERNSIESDILSSKIDHKIDIEYIDLDQEITGFTKNNEIELRDNITKEDMFSSEINYKTEFKSAYQESDILKSKMSHQRDNQCIDLDSDNLKTKIIGNFKAEYNNLSTNKMINKITHSERTLNLLEKIKNFEKPEYLIYSCFQKRKKKYSDNYFDQPISLLESTRYYNCEEFSMSDDLSNKDIDENLNKIYDGVKNNVQREDIDPKNIQSEIESEIFTSGEMLLKKIFQHCEISMNVIFDYILQLQNEVRQERVEAKQAYQRESKLRVVSSEQQRIIREMKAVRIGERRLQGQIIKVMGQDNVVNKPLKELIGINAQQS